eukprot:TRINITY_DN4934_c0_g1_i4.p1 TRINITY_DN4934_c0_g1~~TRINITY_DN4934_c0_g1_i4.p1  ORF type:complete len:119 (-),score=6.29 TRINITY_DN4934_c0_g1_i4:80-436(-)
MKINTILNNILHHRYQRYRQLLDHWTQLFITLLVDIRKIMDNILEEIYSLYKDIAHHNKSNTYYPHASSIFGAELMQCSTQEKENFRNHLNIDQDLDNSKRKIELWRSLYKTISCCIL